MRPRAIYGFVAIVCALAAVSQQLVPWIDVASLSLTHAVGLFLLMGFGLLSEHLAVGLSASPRGGSQTITFIPLIATVLLFGPAAPVLFMGVTGSIAEIFVRKKEPLRAVFNVAQYVLATSLAGWAFGAAGGVAGADLRSFPFQIIPLAAFLVALLGTNHLMVSLAVAISHAQPLQNVWKGFIGRSGVNAFYDVLVSPLAIVVAFLYSMWGWPGLVLSLLPLLFIRHAYLNAYRLEQANRDLLRALIKAIETRDPYTSGHSQRVSGLAGRIARELGLGARKVEAIEMAALLHDIGKIDAIYVEILRKPHALSSDEWRVMESHVTKGVELLQSLSSVPAEVITAVRHHHEREDGRGYPDRLHGDQIPLGAKIIKVCDAIDAMLSDRPYRAALSIEKVRSELQEYAGRQFDTAVVKCVLRSRVLEEHVEAVRGSQVPSKEAAPRVRKAAVAGRRATARPLAVS